MQARTAPTSPANKKPPHEVAAVWQQGSIQQPPRTPWGKVTMLAFLFGIIAAVGVVVLAGWYIHRYPNSWLARYAMINSTTTVVQQTHDTQKSGIPDAVQRVVATAYGLNKNLGDGGVYRTTDATGFAWPLSGSGWLVTLSGSWSVDNKSIVSVPAVGSAQAIISNISDPATPYVFMKTTEISAQPITFAPAESRTIGRQVWIVTNQAAFPRLLGSIVEPRWISSDRSETYATLDTSITAPIGSAVVDEQGRVIGLLGSESRVWLADSIEMIVRDVVQTAAIHRPSIGIRTIDLTTATVVGEPKASGLQIGAGDGQVAVVAKSPADKSGLKSGDIITAIDNVTNPEDIFLLLNKYHSGDDIKVVYRRAEKEKTTTITVGSIGS